jgi:hypothetical protein
MEFANNMEDIETLKQVCGKYYSHTEEKLDGDRTLYKTVPMKGVRHMPLGYFESEEGAVSALYRHLFDNKLI